MKYKVGALCLSNPGSANAMSHLFYWILTLVFNFVGWYKLGSRVLKKVYHSIDVAESLNQLELKMLLNKKKNWCAPLYIFQHYNFNEDYVKQTHEKVINVLSCHGQLWHHAFSRVADEKRVQTVLWEVWQVGSCIHEMSRHVFDEHVVVSWSMKWNSFLSYRLSISLSALKSCNGVNWAKAAAPLPLMRASRIHADLFSYKFNATSKCSITALLDLCYIHFICVL